MKRAISIVMLLLLGLSGLALAQPNTVMRVLIHGEVDPVMARYVERSIAQAEKNGVRAIVFDINTPGGWIDAAVDISLAIMQSPVKTVSVVTGQAWSAGTLIALSTDESYMYSGASMGAAEPIPRTEKIVSAWRGAMEAAAESNGRDPLIAAAMVDSDLQIPGVVEEGKLLSLSARKAVELGMTDGVVSNLQEALANADLPTGVLEDSEITFTENVLRLLTRPGVATLLLAIGLVGVIVEIVSTGFGVPGVVGLIALGLYFGGNILSGQASQIVLLIFALSVILLGIEAFAPGFGVAGFTGIVLLVASLVLAAGDTALGLRMVSLAGIITVGLLALSWRFLSKKKVFERFSLQGKSTAELGYLSSAKDTSLQGMKGVAVTPLRPSGTAEIDGKRYSVITEGVFVSVGTSVVVSRIDGGRIVVKPE
jgi:membrane-bound serine protease (ClpP class)